MAKNRNAQHLHKERDIPYQKALQFWEKHRDAIHAWHVDRMTIRDALLVWWDNGGEPKTDLT